MNFTRGTTISAARVATVFPRERDPNLASILDRLLTISKNFGGGSSSSLRTLVFLLCLFDFHSEIEINNKSNLYVFHCRIALHWILET